MLFYLTPNSPRSYFLGREGKKAWGRSGSQEEEERKMQGKKEKEGQKQNLVFRSGRGRRSETNRKSKVVAKGKKRKKGEKWEDWS